MLEIDPSPMGSAVHLTLTPFPQHTTTFNALLHYNQKRLNQTPLTASSHPANYFAFICLLQLLKVSFYLVLNYPMSNDVIRTLEHKRKFE